jgi:hypothetical protein
MSEGQAKWDWREFGGSSPSERSTPEDDFTRPDPVPLELDGQSGNAFAILVLCREAALAAGWSLVQWDRFYWEATASNHDMLLDVVKDWFEVR